MAFILALLGQSWVGTLISSVIKWFTDRAAAREAASEEMQADVAAHQDDGLKSVKLKESIEAQMASLEREDAAADAAIITTKENT